MSLHAVSLALTTDLQLTDEQVRDAAARWASRAGFDLGMTSTSRDEPWLRVSAMVKAEPIADPAAIVQPAVETLAAELRDVGATVTEWLAVELLSQAEIERRSRIPRIPPMVNTAELAELAELTLQRIYQLESERKAGKRTDFPTPVLEGYWLRSMAEHWAATRKRKPGPAPRGTR